MMKYTNGILFLLLAILRGTRTFASYVPRCNWPLPTNVPAQTFKNVRIYRQRRALHDAEALCDQWEKMTGTPTTFSIFKPRGRRDIITKSAGSCSFTIFVKGTNHGKWTMLMCQVSNTKRCGEASQQRVLPLERCENCDESVPENNWQVIDWEQDSDATWIAKNSGYDLEIKIRPIGSVRTKIRIGGEEDFLRVSKIRIKWGSGSEHSFGKYKYAGEIQIFHERHDRIGGKHALSFFISKRNNPPNPAWSDFLRKIHHRCNFIGSTNEMTSPPILRNLIGEDAAKPGEVRLTHRLLKYIRYKGMTSEAPCEEHVWTVFDNALYLSRSQLTSLQGMKSFPTSTSQTNFSPSSEKFCRTTRTLL